MKYRSVRILTCNPGLKEHKMLGSAKYNMTKTPQRYACQICEEQVPIELSIFAEIPGVVSNLFNLFWVEE
jgi:hypothetical protein